MTQAQITDAPLLSEADFIAGFHAIGEERYHHKHPFHGLMHEGKLTRGQLQAWALNRYYYQSRVFDGDAALIVVAIERPGLELASREFSLVHQAMKWMFVVIALFADGVKTRNEVSFREQRRVGGLGLGHTAISIPS